MCPRLLGWGRSGSASEFAQLRFGELSVLLALLQVLDVETRSPVESCSNLHHHRHATCAQGDEIDLADIINVIIVIAIRTATLLQPILAF